MAVFVGPAAPSLLAERLPELRAALETYRASARKEIAAGERELATPAVPEDDGIGHETSVTLPPRTQLSHGDIVHPIEFIGAPFPSFRCHGGVADYFDWIAKIGGA